MVTNYRVRLSIHVERLFTRLWARGPVPDFFAHTSPLKITPIIRSGQRSLGVMLEPRDYDLIEGIRFRKYVVPSTHKMHKQHFIFVVQHMVLMAVLGRLESV